MEVSEAIRRRRAVRDYLPEPVSKKLLEEIVDAANWAPSGMNTQPCRFTVVTDQALMARISGLCKSFAFAEMPSEPDRDHFRDLMREPSFNIFYNAPVLLAVSAPSHEKWAVEDCALAAQNAMLMALERGLGSCWIGFAQGWLNSPEGLAAFGLPRDQRVVAPLIFGYPKSSPPRGSRKVPDLQWVGTYPVAKTDIPVAKTGMEASSASPPSQREPGIARNRS